jgi:hypothetical protein
VAAGRIGASPCGHLQHPGARLVRRERLGDISPRAAVVRLTGGRLPGGAHLRVRTLPVRSLHSPRTAVGLLGAAHTLGVAPRGREGRDRIRRPCRCLRCSAAHFMWLLRGFPFDPAADRRCGSAADAPESNGESMERGRLRRCDRRPLRDRLCDSVSCGRSRRGTAPAGVYSGLQPRALCVSRRARGELAVRGDGAPLGEQRGSSLRRTGSGRPRSGRAPGGASGVGGNLCSRARVRSPPLSWPQRSPVRILVSMVAGLQRPQGADSRRTVRRAWRGRKPHVGERRCSRSS